MKIEKFFVGKISKVCSEISYLLAVIIALKFVVTDRSIKYQSIITYVLFFKKYNSAREEEWKCDFKKLKDGYKVSNYRIITNS